MAWLPSRRALLMKAAEALLARRDAFAATMIAAPGATFGWAMSDIELAAGVVREAARITTQITGEAIPSDKPRCSAIVVPLACGNTVIMKTSETCPRTRALVIEAVCRSAS